MNFSCSLLRYFVVFKPENQQNVKVIRTYLSDMKKSFSELTTHHFSNRIGEISSQILLAFLRGCYRQVNDLIKNAIEEAK